MSYPSPVPPTPQGWDLGWSPGHGVTGIEYLGNQYLVLQQGGDGPGGANPQAGDGKIHVLKSTDLGLTWADLASFVFPSSGYTVLATDAYTVCQDAHLIYIMGVDTGGTGTDALCGPVYLWVWDMSTDAFTVSAVTPTGAPTVNKFWHGAPPNGYTPTEAVGFNLVRRGTGDMLLLYPGAYESISGNNWARVNVIRFDGTGFSGDTQLGGQAGIDGPFSQGGASFDSAHILHVMLADTSKNYYHVGMTAGGVFGTLQTLESAAEYHDQGPPYETSNFLPSFSNNGTDSIGFLGLHDDGSDNGLLTLYYAASGDIDPVWHTTTIPLAQVITGSGQALSTALQTVNAVLVAFWTQTGFAPNWNLSDGLGQIRVSFALTSNITSWSVDTELIPAVDPTMGATGVTTWQGASIGIGVLGNFRSSAGDLPEESDFAPFAPLSLTYDNHPGTVGTPYTGTLVASGGTPPYTYAITAGGLPPGLTLVGNVISGTPTTPGTYPFTARVTDSLAGQAFGFFSITISAITAPGDLLVNFIGAKVFKGAK